MFDPSVTLVQSIFDNSITKWTNKKKNKTFNIAQNTSDGELKFHLPISRKVAVREFLRFSARTSHTHLATTNGGMTPHIPLTIQPLGANSGCN